MLICEACDGSAGVQVFSPTWLANGDELRQAADGGSEHHLNGSSEPKLRTSLFRTETFRYFHIVLDEKKPCLTEQGPCGGIAVLLLLLARLTEWLHTAL